MANKLTKKSQGFTIIEVLIVLAIAGLIMLIVFLAVPALQRNSRNTAIRNDAGNILAAVGEYVSNNNGQLPTDVACDADGTVHVTGTANEVTAKVRAGTDCAADTSNPGVTGLIHIAFNRKCDFATNTIATTDTNRAVSAGFKVEAGGSEPDQCVES
jgi:prepilin-type N-terminal cleavage/methylation domain-containing protein